MSVKKEYAFEKAGWLGIEKVRIFSSNIGPTLLDSGLNAGTTLLGE
jgi:hypothetical protein